MNYPKDRSVKIDSIKKSIKFLDSIDAKPKGLIWGLREIYKKHTPNPKWNELIIMESIRSSNYKFITLAHSLFGWNISTKFFNSN